MQIAPTLNWAPWQFDPNGGPIQFRIAGNPDTAVGVKFLLYLNDKSKADEIELREESVPYVVEPRRINGTVNRLKFIFEARPTMREVPDLFVWVEALQLNSAKGPYKQEYAQTLESGKDFFRMADGVTLTL